MLLVIGSGLCNWRKGEPYLREISYALGSILPAGGAPPGLSEGRGTAPGQSAGHDLRDHALDRLRRHDLLDGRFPPVLRTAENLGPGKRALDRILLVVFALVPMTFATLLVAVGQQV